MTNVINTGMNFESFSEWVKKERNNKGWTQTQLSAKSGVSMRTIQNIEKGENIKLDIFFHVIKALDKQVVIGE